VDFAQLVVERLAGGDVGPVPYAERLVAERTGLSPSTVRRALRDLVAASALERGESLAPRVVEGRRWPGTATYVPLPALAAVVEAAAPEPQPEVGDVAAVTGAEPGVGVEDPLAAEVGVAPRGLLPVGGGIGPRHASDPDDRGGRQ
jgi:hypothetical protein